MNSNLIYSNIGIAPILCFGSDLLLHCKRQAGLNQQNNLFSFGLFNDQNSYQLNRKLLIDTLDNYDLFLKNSINAAEHRYTENHYNWVYFKNIDYYYHYPNVDKHPFDEYVKQIIDKNNFCADIYLLFNNDILDFEYFNKLYLAILNISRKKLFKFYLFSYVDLISTNQNIEITKLNGKIYNSKNVDKDVLSQENAFHHWYINKLDFQNIIDRLNINIQIQIPSRIIFQYI